MEVDGVIASVFGPTHIDPMAGAGVDFAGDKIRLDGELPVAVAIDEDGEVDAIGSAEIVEGIEGGAHGAAAIEDIVGEDHGGTVEVAGEVGGMDFGCGTMVEIIAVEGHIDLAGGDGLAEQTGQFGGQPCGEVDTAFLNAQEGEAIGVGETFGDLVGHTADGEAEGRGGHQDLGRRHEVAQFNSLGRASQQESCGG
jgi:hypothetical protein